MIHKRDELKAILKVIPFNSLSASKICDAVEKFKKKHPVVYAQVMEESKLKSGLRLSQIAGNIVKCFSFLTILIELSKGKKMTGYEVMKRIRSLGFKASSGTVYYQLGMLSEWGYIKGEKQETRTKYARRGSTAYTMTEKGVKAFQEFKKKWRKPVEYTHKNLIFTASKRARERTFLG